MESQAAASSFCCWLLLLKHLLRWGARKKSSTCYAFFSLGLSLSLPYFYFWYFLLLSCLELREVRKNFPIKMLRPFETCSNRKLATRLTPKIMLLDGQLDGRSGCSSNFNKSGFLFKKHNWNCSQACLSFNSRLSPVETILNKHKIKLLNLSDSLSAKNALIFFSHSHVCIFSDFWYFYY